jgi:Outer membrane protein beta-barrel domain
LPKFFLLSIILLTGIFTIAQTRISVFAGPQITTARYHVGDTKQSTEFKPGFQLGAGAKIEFDNKLYFSPAIYYSFKGYKVALNRAATPPDLAAVNNNISVHTAEIAFLMQYDFSNHPYHFFVKFGPSADFQLYGKEKIDLVDGGRISRGMKYSYSDYGRYAASAILQFGYETAYNFIFYIHYAHGFTNLNNADAGPSIQYRVIGITIGKYLK